MISHRDLKAKTLGSVRWSAAGEMVTRAVQPLVVLVLARMLGPADFGVIGMAMVAISFAEMLQDFGLGKTLVQTEADADAFAGQMFWFNLFLSVMIYAGIWITAPQIGAFFRAPGSETLLRVLCLRIVISAFAAVQLAMLQRELEFRTIFASRLASSLVPGLVSLPLAYLGYGAWSLAWGILAGAVVQTLVLWFGSSWRPAFRFEFGVWEKMLSFSKWVFFEGVLATAIQSGDSVVVGHFMGPHDLGLYRMGVTFMGLVTALAFSPLQPVAFSFFSRFRSEPEVLRKYYLKGTQIIAALCLPLGFGLAVLAPSYVPLVMGAKWAGAIGIFSLLSVKLAFDWLCGLNSNIFTAMGRPVLNVKLLAIVASFSLPLFIWSAQFGIIFFCGVRLAAAVADDILNYILVVRNLLKRYNAIWIMTRWSLLGTLLMVAAIQLVQSVIPQSSPGGLAVLVAVAIATYLGSLLLFDREGFLSYCRLLHQAASAGGVMDGASQNASTPEN